MAAPNRPDLIRVESQCDLFGEQPTPVFHADTDQVREGLNRILAEAREEESEEDRRINAIAARFYARRDGR